MSLDDLTVRLRIEENNCGSQKKSINTSMVAKANVVKVGSKNQNKKRKVPTKSRIKMAAIPNDSKGIALCAAKKDIVLMSVTIANPKANIKCSKTIKETLLKPMSQRLTIFPMTSLISTYLSSYLKPTWWVVI